MIGNWNYGTGRRKSSVARVFIKEGHRARSPSTAARSKAVLRSSNVHHGGASALLLTNNGEAFDIKVNVHGGGESGQTGAVRLGITRADRLRRRPQARTEPRRLRHA